MSPYSHTDRGGRSVRSQRWRVRPAALVFGVVLPVLLAACSGGDDGTAPRQAEDPGSPPADGGKLTLGIGSEPTSLDPGKIRGGTNLYYVQNVFEQLLRRGVDGEQQPGLVEDYEVSADGLVYTLTLREGVTFHNGEPFTADDVKFSFERYIDPEIENPAAFQLDENLESVEVVSPTEVEIRLKQVDGAFLSGNMYVYIVPKDYITENGDDFFGENPIGTGPFMFESFTRTTSFSLSRFEDYWGEKPGYRDFEFRILPDDNTRVSSLLAGEVDLISAVPPQAIPQIEAQQDLMLRSTLVGDNVLINFDNHDPSKPWADPKVREALAYAIDNDAIIENVLASLGQPSVGMSANIPGSDEIGIDPKPYDPDRAREMLADAGYPDGFSITFYAPVNGRLPNSEQVAQAVAGYWSDIGVETNVQIDSYEQWLTQMENGSPADGAFFVLWGDGQFDPQNRLTGTTSCEGIYSQVCDDTLDETLERVETTPDREERKQIYLDAFRYINEQQLSIYLYSAEGAFAMHESVNWEPWQGRGWTIMENAHPA